MILTLLKIIPTVLGLFKKLSFVSKIAGFAGPFIGKYKIKLIIGLIIIALLCGAGWYVRSLQNKIAKLEATNIEHTNTIAVMKERCEANMSSLTASVNHQNAETDRMHRLLVQEQINVNKRIAAAVANQKKYDKDVQGIIQGKKPENCQAAIEYLIDGKGDLSW